MMFLMTSCSSLDVSHKEAKEKSLELKKGMTPKEVEALFGAPGERKTSQYGQDTKKGAWTGLSYEYKFATFPTWTKLKLVFQRDKNGDWGWLNNWSWLEY